MDDGAALAEKYMSAAKLRDEYEQEGGFTKNSDSEDRERRRSDISELFRRSVFLAMQAFYQLEAGFGGVTSNEVGFNAIRQLILSDVLYYESGPKIKESVTHIFDGVCQNLPEIDAMLHRHITCNWSVGRLAVVERSLMRIGIFELCFEKKRADKTVIKVCSDLVGEYATERSMSFVYGVLCEVRKEKEASEKLKSGDVGADVQPEEKTEMAGGQARSAGQSCLASQIGQICQAEEQE